MSSSAPESNLFCASSSVPSSVEAYLLRVLFGCEDLVQVVLHCALRCGRVLCTPRVTSDEFLFFSWELQVVHSLSNDVRAAWRRVCKHVFVFPLRAQFWFRFLAVRGLAISCWYQNVNDVWLMQIMATCLPVDLKTVLLQQQNERLCTEWNFCRHSYSACSVTRTGMTRSSKLKTHQESRATHEDYTTAA